MNAQDILGFLVLLSLAVWIYASQTGKGFKEIIQDIKEGFKWMK